MSSKYVRDQFFTETQTWASQQTDPPSVIQIYDPNNFNPPSRSEGMFVALQYSRAPEEQITIGCPEKNIYREEGVIFLHVAFPYSEDGEWENALTLAESARTFFRARRFNSIRCYEVDPPELGEGASIISNMGNWSGAVIAIDYEYDVQGGQ